MFNSTREINKEAKKTGKRLFNYATVFKKKKYSAVAMTSPKSKHLKSSTSARKLGQPKMSVKYFDRACRRTTKNGQTSFMNLSSRNFKLL